MSEDRPILRVPGRPGRPKKAPDPVEQSPDDLAEFEPGGELPAADPVQAQLAELKAEITRLKRKGDEAAPKPEGRPEMSEEEAEAALARDVAAGLRPRAILTPSGWMTHREMARVPASIGNATIIKG